MAFLSFLAFLRVGNGDLNGERRRLKNEKQDNDVQFGKGNEIDWQKVGNEPNSGFN